MQLNTDVTQAQPVSDGSAWTVHTTDRATGISGTHTCDYLIVCNGIFSAPMVPDFPGAAEFKEAGGRVCQSSQLAQLDGVEGKHVLVVARQLVRKVPKVLMNVLNCKFLLLTRLGEGLFEYLHVKVSSGYCMGLASLFANPRCTRCNGLLPGSTSSRSLIWCRPCRLRRWHEAQ
jgi:hypothetical protein